MTTEIRQDTGYGLIPKRIMRDKNLTIQAKAIYSYLASFAGNTGRAFPSVSLMLGELGISRDTFYRYRNELEEAGAIEVVKERTEGKFARNIYFLHNAINPPCPKSSYTVNSTTVKPDTVSSYTVNQDTISNNLKSNSFKSNSSKNSVEDKSSNETLKDNLKYTDDSKEIKLARHMREELLRIKSDSRVPSNTAKGLQGWARDIDYIIRLDKRDPQMVADLFTWAQEDNFWTANVRSPGKLRKQWDTLEIQMGRESNETRTKQPTKKNGKDEEIDWAARAGVQSF